MCFPWICETIKGCKRVIAAESTHTSRQKSNNNIQTCSQTTVATNLLYCDIKSLSKDLMYEISVGHELWTADTMHFAGT